MPFPICVSVRFSRVEKEFFEEAARWVSEIESSLKVLGFIDVSAVESPRIRYSILDELILSDLS